MASWLNPIYNVKAISAAKEQFAKTQNLTLLLFLSELGLLSFKNMAWSENYEPLSHSYKIASPPSFVNSSFVNLISQVVGKKLKLKTAQVRAFLEGDYTLLADDTKPAKGYAVILDVNSVAEEVGSYTSFLNDKEEVIRVVPKKNALFIVNQSGLKSFVKYHNHKSQTPKVFLYCEFA